MTPQQVAELGPAFAAFLRPLEPCVAQKSSRGHFAAFCRGLLSEPPRKSVEPIALAAGIAARTLQEFSPGVLPGGAVVRGAADAAAAGGKRHR